MNPLATYCFTNSAVRQLAWVIGSPFLLNGNSNQHWPDQEWLNVHDGQLEEWLLQLDQEPRTLLDHLESQRDHRLGARFESLIEYWLNNSNDYDCIERRLQLVDDNRTLGEFDFIVRNRITNQIEHWEVASKFYLGVADRDSNCLRWIGPGKRDRLSRKLEHLESHQLKLGQTELARSFLQTRGIEINQTRSFVKGRLFHPFAPSFELPSEQFSSVSVNPQHERGRWVEFGLLREWARNAQMHVLNKSDWFDPKPGAGAVLTKFDSDLIEPALERGPFCLDLSMAGSAERIFVVESGWFDKFEC